MLNEFSQIPPIFKCKIRTFIGENSESICARYRKSVGGGGGGLTSDGAATWGHKKLHAGVFDGVRLIHPTRLSSSLHAAPFPATSIFGTGRRTRSGSAQCQMINAPSEVYEPKLWSIFYGTAAQLTGQAERTARVDLFGGENVLILQAQAEEGDDFPPHFSMDDGGRQTPSFDRAEGEGREEGRKEGEGAIKQLFGRPAGQPRQLAISLGRSLNRLSPQIISFPPLPSSIAASIASASHRQSKV